jgi:hypothetical protein
MAQDSLKNPAELQLTQETAMPMWRILAITGCGYVVKVEHLMILSGASQENKRALIKYFRDGLWGLIHEPVPKLINMI